MTTTPSAPSHRFSKHVAEHELADGQFAVWNTFFPQVTVVPKEVLDRLKTLPENEEEWPAESLAELRDRRIVYTGDDDPAEADFFRSAREYVEHVDAETRRFYDDELPYESLSLVNSGCNLGCSYCVSYFGDDAREEAKRNAARGDAREEAVLRVVDQFMARARKAGRTKTRVHFNGGEILLRWNTVKRVLEHLRAEYPDITVDAEMNTNATLLTKEIADVLAEHGVTISVSIDGYEELHEESRVHHGGVPSFEKVMAGIENYNGASAAPLVSYQGTIQNLVEFDEEKFFDMVQHGFKGARLAPNVLDRREPARGVEAAWWEASLAVKSQETTMSLTQSQFEIAVERAGTGGSSAGFRPNCGGLSGTGKLRSIVVNMDSMQASHLCSFSSAAAVPMAQIDEDIDDPAIWHAARQYITDRLEILKTACKGWSVIGICQGGCVYNALDVHNKLNPAGCAYQRGLWRHAIEFNHTGAVRPLPPNPEDTRQGRASEPAVKEGCGAPTAAVAPDGRKIWAMQPTA